MATPALPPTIFSARRRLARSARARRMAGAPQWLAAAMVEDIAERIAFMRLEPSRALVIAERPVSAAALGFARSVDMLTTGEFDPEAPLPTGGYDLIVSIGALDTVNDLPGALLHHRAALAEGGLLIASLIGAGSLPRLRAALMAADGDRPAARMHPGIDAQSGAALLQRAGFRRQVADGWTLRVRYGALATLIDDLRAQALISALADAPPPLTRAGWRAAQATFLAGADADGRVLETLEIVTLTGWR